MVSGLENLNSHIHELIYYNIVLDPKYTKNGTWYIIPYSKQISVYNQVITIFNYIIPLLQQQFQQYKELFTPSVLIIFSALPQFIISFSLVCTQFLDIPWQRSLVQYEDSLCAFRSYLGYVSSAVFNFSFLLQTLYRYVIVVYPTRLFWQSVRFQSLLICLTWFFAILCPILFIIKNEIIYDVDGQICHIPYRLSFSIIYGALINYIIPISITMLFYLKLVRHVYGMSKRITSANRLARAQNELKMVQRIVTLIIILITLGVPFVVFITMSLFTNPPKYHTRIGYVFFNVSLALVMITLFQFTDPLKATAKKLINIRPNNITS
ncbi:unnamed protein product [Rotaria sordida]|uniref:G-protein coupled receptors family 1 profile domain-containing protein n=1 Tax=Rotaria sordida TaxID=392033 RepID=A0A815PUV6_9BILA|nr:unnamed protein product [Rotaria sordida]